MRLPLLLSAATLSLLWIEVTAAERGVLPPRYQGIAAEKCLRDLDRFDKTLHESGFGMLAPGSSNPFARRGYLASDKTPRQKIRTLRNAAYDLAIRGNESQCQTLLDTMQHLYRQHQRAADRDLASQNTGPAWRRAHLAGSHKLSSMERSIHAAGLIGAELRNPEDQGLGEIVDLIFEPATARATLVLVVRGGFMGFGGDVVAVRWSDLHATEDHELFVLDVSMSDFEKAPGIDGHNLQKIVRGSWRESLNEFWNKSLRK